MSPVIELQQLAVRLGGRDILRGLTGSVSGRTIGLLGPNGAGKSTLINTLLGFYPISGGTGKILGLDIKTQQREIRRQIGYMPENDSFIGNMSAVTQVRYMAELSGLPPEAALELRNELAPLLNSVERETVDRDLLQRALENLVRNAAEAGATDVRIVADATTIEVIDNGPGLPKRALDSLFVAFAGSPFAA